MHVSGGVDEECDVGDGDERSPHDPDERGAPSRCPKPSRPLAPQTPQGACHVTLASGRPAPEEEEEEEEFIRIQWIL